MHATEALAQLAGAAALEFLAFTLGSEEYGVDIQQVQELRSYDSVTRIAQAPDFIKGVINLRGVIVPIIDLRIKFGVGAPAYDQFTVVIILNLGGRVVGAVVDSVSDVITLPAEQVKAAPRMGAAMDTEYVTGVGTLDGRMLTLLDMKRLMGNDMQLIERIAA